MLLSATITQAKPGSGTSPDARAGRGRSRGSTAGEAESAAGAGFIFGLVNVPTARSVGINPPEFDPNQPDVGGHRNGQKVPYCRPNVRCCDVGGWACHAEGRGFESLQPLSEKPRSSGVFCVSGRRCHRHPGGNNVGPVQCGFRIIGGARMLAASTGESEVRDPWVTRMRSLPATVVSTTMEEPLDWPDATVVTGDAVDIVARLKEESKVPLRSHGSLSMNRALMAAGLVDRVQVTLFPVITGQTGDDPIFQGAADFDLELVEHRTLDGHIQELIYRPTLH